MSRTPMAEPDVSSRTVDLLHERPDLAGLFPIADAIDAAVRWSA